MVVKKGKGNKKMICSCIWQVCSAARFDDGYSDSTVSLYWFHTSSVLGKNVQSQAWNFNHLPENSKIACSSFSTNASEIKCFWFYSKIFPIVQLFSFALILQPQIFDFLRRLFLYSISTECLYHLKPFNLEKTSTYWPINKSIISSHGFISMSWSQDWDVLVPGKSRILDIQVAYGQGFNLMFHPKDNTQAKSFWM